MAESLIGLGRRHAPDDRDKAYLLPRVAVEVTSKYWPTGPVLDQGATPMCVAYAGTQWLQSPPIRNKPPMSPADLYHQSQLNDEWPGTDYDGTSTRGLMKTLKGLGMVGDYRWALDAETVIAWVLAKGPVLVGTNWHRSMFMPDRNGYISPYELDASNRRVLSPNDGGHEWLIDGASRVAINPDKTVGKIRMINSWGSGWSSKGRAWITRNDLDFLIKSDGEACVATEILVA